MELTSLRQFIAVARAGHMTRAAQGLGLSQPTVSAAMRKLEEELGTELMHRTARGVVLTDAGAAFLQHAEAAVQQAEAGAAAVREIAGLGRGQIRIGGGATAVGYLLPSIIRRFRAEHPEIHVYLREAASREIAGAVARADLDLGLVTLPLHATDEQDLIVIAERRDELRLAVPAGHALATKKSFRFADLADEPIIGFEAGSAIRRLIDDAGLRHGVELSTVMELRAIDIIIRMVRAGVGVAIVSALALEQQEQGAESVMSLACRDGTITRTLALVRRADFTPSPAAGAFELELLWELRGR